MGTGHWGKKKAQTHWEVAVQQIKLFLGSDEELSKVEAEVNAWLKSSGVKPLSIQGNLAPRTMMKQGDAKAFTTESGMRRFAPSDVLMIVTYEVG